MIVTLLKAASLESEFNLGFEVMLDKTSISVTQDY